MLLILLVLLLQRMTGRANMHVIIQMVMIMLMFVLESMYLIIQMTMLKLKLMLMIVLVIMMVRLTRRVAVAMGMPMPVAPSPVPCLAGGGRHELAMLDPFGSQEGVSDGADAGTAPPQDDHLEAVATIQVDMHRGHDLVDVVMLNGVEPVGEFGLVMIEDHGDGPRDLGIRVLHPLFHQGLPHQVAHRLGAIGPGSAPGHQSVETPQ